MIALDEAAHIDDKLFFKVIVPILTVGDTALLALSSPVDSSNHYSKLMNLRDEDTGEPFFEVVQCGQMCDHCKEFLETDPLRAMMCDHIKTIPPWLDGRKQRRMKQLYKLDPATGIQELTGIVTDAYQACFDSLLLDITFGMEPVQGIPSKPKMIFISTDPAGSGRSDMAIASGYYDAAGNFVVSTSSSSFHNVLGAAFGAKVV